MVEELSHRLASRIMQNSESKQYHLAKHLVILFGLNLTEQLHEKQSLKSPSLQFKGLIFKEQEKFVIF